MLAPQVLVALGIASALALVRGRQTTVAPKAKFVPLHPTASTSSLQLTLVLPPTNIDGLHTALYDVSDPKSANYRKHLSKAEVGPFSSRVIFDSSLCDR